MAQHQKRVFKERYCNISCLTAVNVETGEVLWQVGEPSTLAVNQEIPAGAIPIAPVGPGQAAKILTGAPHPAWRRRRCQIRENTL